MGLSEGKAIALLASGSVFIAALLGVSCSSTGDRQNAYGSAPPNAVASAAASRDVTPLQMFREVNVMQRFIPRGRHGRKYIRTMRPRYITVHSTQNYSGDAWAHARALERGKLRAPKRRGGNRIGYLIWHFTVQQDVVVQHLPTNEQGEHADFDGPGNNYSIGIEMCEHRGNSRRATVDRTAKLCASLMYQYNIPLRNVVPHYHWPRKGARPPNKNCPHFLMDNGRPGRKWNAFLAQVRSEYDRIRTPQPPIAMPGSADGEVVAAADAYREDR